ncbi:MAG: hypothetical protein WD844_10070 [Thermoleophilaceae bacterium]
MTRRAVAAILAAAAAASLASCGGDDSDVKALLDRAFDQPIGSAVVTADVEVNVEGVEELGEPIRLKVSGPYRSGGDESLPTFDWDVSFSGGGQTIAGNLLSTSENVFVSFGGTAYELGEETVSRFNEDLASETDRGEEQSLAQFGIDPAEWLSDAQDEGDADVAGVSTTHVQAKVDVPRMLDDLNTLIDRAGGAVTGAAPPPKLTGEQQDQVAEAVSDPVLDVYVGKDDNVIRRLSANLELDVPEGSRDDIGGIEGGRISFSVQFADVGRDVQVEAPADARPIAELAEQLGGLGALGGGVIPQGGGGGGGGAQDEFGRYAQCLEEADPSDLQAIQACSDLLQ